MHAAAAAASLGVAGNVCATMQHDGHGACVQVIRRVKAGDGASSYSGHVLHGSEGLIQESKHRPQDLRITNAVEVRVAPDSTSNTAYGELLAAAAEATDGVPGRGASGVAGSDTLPWPLLLRTGSAIAAEARALIKRSAGYRTSAGVACNKVLAKLASGLHKPDDQTVLPPPIAAAFVAPLPARSLTGTFAILSCIDVHCSDVSYQGLLLFTGKLLVCCHSSAVEH